MTWKGALTQPCQLYDLGLLAFRTVSNKRLLFKKKKEKKRNENMIGFPDCPSPSFEELEDKVEKITQEGEQRDGKWREKVR